MLAPVSGWAFVAAPQRETGVRVARDHTDPVVGAGDEAVDGGRGGAVVAAD